MIYLLIAIVSFWLGYKVQYIERRTKELVTTVKEKVSKPKIEEPESIIIDELDEVQVAKFERDEMMKKLNNIQPDE